MTDATEPAFGPARPSVAVAVGAGSVAVLLVGVTGATGFGLAVLGWASLVGGIAARSRTAVTAGLCVLWLAIVVGALAGLAVEAVGVALVAAVLAWDAACRGLTLGEQLTTRASTARIEGMHALATVGVGLGCLGGAYALWWVSSGVSAPMTVIGFALAVGVVAYAIET